MGHAAPFRARAYAAAGETTTSSARPQAGHVGLASVRAIIASPASRDYRTPMRSALALIAALALAPQAQAAQLTFGRATEQSSIDPQYAQTGNNSATASAMFERLVGFDATLQLHPGLAVSSRLIDPLNWEIRLRAGVKFHDGSDFTADDVVYSLNRVRDIPHSPAPFSHAVSNVAALEMVDPLTLRVRTIQPAPLLMQEIGYVFIIPAKLGANVGVDDFNSGKAAIGTGPYRFRSWTPNDRLLMDANPGWWGGKPTFDSVTLKFIPNSAARTAALLSGEVDLIDGVQPVDVPRLSVAAGVHIFSIPSVRLVYLALDSSRDESPFVTDRDGRPLEKNPLRDVRVRQALSHMINRVAIVSRVLGAGEPAGQIVPDGQGGYAPELRPDAFDLSLAKRLLTEAGWPQGFGLTVHTSSDRFPGDAQVGQAIGQMFSRGGLQVNGVEALPYAVYAPAATARKYSAFVFTWAGLSGNASEGLRSVLATYDAKTGMGALNRVRWSNAEFDQLLGEAAVEFDEARRNALLADATRVAMQDAALLPLYWIKLSWASRGNITFQANMSEDSSVLFAGVK
jgi:peptide/nickel transport system substrate-binding protein